MNWQNLRKEQNELHQLIDLKFKQLLDEVGPEIHVDRNDLRGSVYDGCLDVKKYANASKHILWILKEHNDIPASLGTHWVAFADALGDEEDDYVKRFKTNVGSYRSLRLIERASRELLEIDNESPTETFKSIAIINLGKCPGENTTPANRLPKLKEWWGEVLVHQVKIYSPDVILIPGSHFPHVKSLFDDFRYLYQLKVKTGRFAARAELYVRAGTPIVHIQHPSWYGCNEKDWVNAILGCLENAGKDGIR